MGGLIRAERDSRSAACVSYGWHTVVSVTLLLVLTATEAIGQSELQGRVLADGSRRPVANAEVAVPRLEARAVRQSRATQRFGCRNPSEGAMPPEGFLVPGSRFPLDQSSPSPPAEKPVSARLELK